MGVMVVFIDMLSALSVGALLLAKDGVATIPLANIGEISNPLQGLHRHQALIYCIAAILGLQLIRELVLLANELLIRRFGLDVGVYFRHRVSSVALSASFEQVVKMNRQDLIVYGTSFAPSVGTFAIEFSRLFGIAIVIIVYSIFFLITEPVAFMLVMLIVLVLIIITNRFLIRVEELSHVARDVELAYYGALQDSVSGLRDITIFGRQSAFLKKIRNLIQQIKALQWKTAVYKCIITPLQRSVALLLLGCVLIFFVGFAGEGELVVSPGRLIFVVFILLRLYGPVAQLNMIRSSLLSRSGPITTIVEFLDNLGAYAAPETKKVEIKVKSVAKPNHSEHFKTFLELEKIDKITLDKLSFNYEDGNKAALSNVSFTIPLRATTAIVGPSGSGKSTIIDLLTCLRTPTTGEILIGDIPLNNIDITVWRETIATIHQQGYIFNGTIVENITLFRDDFTNEEIDEAVSRANFLDFVQSTPMGMNTRLGGPDIPLSGGQRQRLQIARAFLLKPQLLILDEATSAQDALLEEALLRSIKQNFPSITILVIAHRFSAIREADHIIVMDEGHVVDTGDWRSLKQRPGLFRDLFNAQFLEN